MNPLGSDTRYFPPHQYNNYNTTFPARWVHAQYHTADKILVTVEWDIYWGINQATEMKAVGPATSRALWDPMKS